LDVLGVTRELLCGEGARERGEIEESHRPQAKGTHRESRSELHLCTLTKDGFASASLCSNSNARSSSRIIGNIPMAESSFAPALTQALILAISAPVGCVFSFRGGIFFSPLPSMLVTSRLIVGLPATTTFFRAFLVNPSKVSSVTPPLG